MKKMLATLLLVLLLLTGCNTQKNEYVVSFVDDKKLFSLQDTIVEKNGKILAPDVPPSPTYKFGGWYVDKDFTMPFDFENEIKEDVTLYAKWTEFEYFTVTLVSDVDVVSQTKTISVRENLRASISDPKATKDNYEFAGWYLDQEFNKPFDSTNPITENLTLYAKWIVYNMYSLTISDEMDLIATKEIKVRQDSKAELPIPPQSYAYEFAGWYEDELYTKAFDINALITSNITIYAKWVKLSLDQIMDNYIDGLLANTQSYVPSWNKEGFKGRWNYIDGVFLNSVVNLYHTTNNEKYKTFFLNYVKYYVNSDGEFVNPSDQSSGYRSGELDSVCESRILFDAYDMTNDTRYLKAIERTYNELMSMSKCQGTNNFWHKDSYENQIWLDGMYMYVPFLARYAKLKNNQDIFDEIKSQYQYIKENMCDERTGLYFHGHDTTKKAFWADKQTGNSSSIWLRSMGWYIVSLVDVLEYFPEGENKEYLKSVLDETLKTMLNYQDSKSKMFYQLVDQGDKQFLVSANYLKDLKNDKYLLQGNYVDVEIANYLESSGSSMVAYTLMKASRLGYIDEAFAQKGREVFDGIFAHSFSDGELNDICITAGLGPENRLARDGSPAYYLAEPVGSNDAKGVGPFIMAYIEYKNTL